MDQRIGQLLGTIIPLSDHDVEEILNEQQASGTKQFGDIALQLGKAKPEHILQAWMRQLETRTDRIDLDRVGVDVQATAYLSAAVARGHQALPIRVVGDELLLAVVTRPEADELAELERVSGKHCKVVLTEAEDVAAMLDRYYPTKSKHVAA
jgi:hypothetical protein